MRIGGFYGFTAPMLVAICDEVLINILQTFNVRLNRTVMYDLKQELFWFNDALEQIKPDLTVDDKALLAYEHNASVQNGKIIGSVLNESNAEEIVQEIMDALMDQCAKRLYEKIDGKDLDVSAFENPDTFIQNLNKYVEDALQGKSFALSNYSTLVRSFMKLLKSTEPKGDKELVKKNIRTFCNLKEELPKVINVLGEEIKLSNNEQKVLAFYKNNKNIELLQQNAILGDYKDDLVFNMSFIDIINRKPTSLYYIVAQYFEILKSVDRKLLQNVLDKVNEEFATFKSFVNERLYANEAPDKFFNLDEVIRYIQERDDSIGDSASVLDFFTDIFEKLGLNEISLDDICKLEYLWYAAEKLNLDGLNDIWGTDFSKDELLKSINVFNKLSIGGINLFTDKLFIDSLTDVIFTNGVRVKKSDEYLKQLAQVCDDIDAFLRTFKPIGGSLNV